MAKIRVPSFRFHDGRAKERISITHFFPKGGDRYFEPFAGAGNVFFEAYKRRLDFKYWLLNDTHPFLNDLTRCRLNEFPSIVDRECFDSWAKSQYPEAEVLARAISYGGKGYHAGFIGSNSYNRDSFLESCWVARSILKHIDLQNHDWQYFDYDAYDGSDFLYFDPPQYAMPTKAYTQIKHKDLINLLKKASFLWCLTGVPNDLYSKDLHAVTTGLINKKIQIWTNYPLTSCNGYDIIVPLENR